MKTNGGPRLKVLLVEDNPGDAELVRAALAEVSWASFEMDAVERFSEALSALARTAYDAVLLDLSLPDSHGLETFSRLHAHDRSVPVVVLSGLDDDGAALNAVRLGAQDYLVKGRYDAELLARSLQYSVERGKLMEQLAQALANLRTLGGRLPICAWCRNVQDGGAGPWISVEEYLSLHTKAVPSHGICPDCRDKIGHV